VGVSSDFPNFSSTPYYLRNAQSYELQIWQILYSEHPCEQKPLKIWEKKERGRIQGLPKFLEYPLLSQEWVTLRTSNLAGIFAGFIRTKNPLKFGRKGSVGISKDFPNFWSTNIISGMGKATNFKFGRCIHSVHANKSPVKICEKRECWPIQ